MAIKLVIEIRDLKFDGANLEAQIEARPLNREVQVTTVSGPHASMTAANFEPGLKNLIINFVQNNYGIALLADEILVR